MSKKFVADYSEDSIGRYFKEVRKSELLTPEQEVELAKRIQSGDEDAIEELCSANLKFVISIAKEYQGQGLALADLISDGNYGLIKAAFKFDETRGFRFISYAVWWIRQAIIQSLNDNSRTIRLPANVILKLNRIKKEIEKFEFENERAPSIGEVINENNATVEGVEELTILDTPIVSSLNTQINEEGGELGDLIADIDDDNDDKYKIDEKLKTELAKTLSVLDDRERDIIESYFGINQHHYGMTLDDIGKKYSLTKERVRQIKEKAIRKLRHNAHNLFDIINE
jgi:RNA polymerase primary sigma factor